MPKRTNGIERRTLFGHPLAAVGGALFIAGGFAFVILLLLDITSPADNPYRSLVTFVAAPAIITLGFLLFVLSAFMQARAARRTGTKVRFRVYIDPSDPRFMRNLWLFLGISAALISLVAYSGTEAFDATDSVSFCGETCHTVMEPQHVTYHNSAHARVLCVDCHIGPGASFWVKSKVDGLRQLWATSVNSYSRPIETPVENLRPAQETCERCHWPKQFYGDKLVSRTYYRTDEQNSPWTISLMLKIGGGNPRTGRLEGIHWHMLGSNDIDYIAGDRKRQSIIWMRQMTSDGDTVIYTDPSAEIPDLDDPETEIRRFDCMDCHNRPSHVFLPPATAINRALSSGEISSRLPYIRDEGLSLLNAEYITKTEALTAIAEGLSEFYTENYPDWADDSSHVVSQASSVLQRVYEDNFFPEMNTDYRVRETNLSHFVNDGCFRCHGSDLETAEGKTIGRDCSTCHLILAQGPSEDVRDLESNLAGLEFEHPEDIDEFWKETKCTDCHTPESGY